MYKLPSDFPFDCFLGEQLTEISFTENTINLIFGATVAITLEGSFVHKQRQDQDNDKIVIPVSSSNLMRLLGHTIETAIGDSEGTLAFTFDDGQVLMCLDDSEDYESYRVRIGAVEIII